eukprot:scaffold21698_cov122-Isochrysis_galbana.AAC.5
MAATRFICENCDVAPRRRVPVPEVSQWIGHAGANRTFIARLGVQRALSCRGGRRGIPGLLACGRGCCSRVVVPLLGALEAAPSACRVLPRAGRSIACGRGGRPREMTRRRKPWRAVCHQRNAARRAC